MQKSHTSRGIFNALRRIDSDLDVQLGRMGQMQRQLDEDSQRLAELATQIEASQARIEALLQTTA